MYRRLITALAHPFSKRKDFTKRIRQEADSAADSSRYESFTRNRNPGVSKRRTEEFGGFSTDTPETTEYPGAQSRQDDEDTRSLRNLSVAPSQINSVLEDFLAGSNKSELLTRSETLLNSIRKSSYRTFVETSEAEFHDFHNRFDYYRENFVAQESNNRMSISEQLNDPKRVAPARDVGVLMRFEEKIERNYGIGSNSFSRKDQTQTQGERQLRADMNAQIDNQMKNSDEPEEGRRNAETLQPETQRPGFGLKEDDKKTHARVSVEKRMAEVEGKLRTMEYLREKDPGIMYSVAATEMLSFRARVGVFKCYLEGWSVREISVRYGILPARVKAIVWQMQHFIEEYLPDMNVTGLIGAMILETMPKVDIQYVDYGLDARAIAEEQMGVVSKRFFRNKLGPVLPMNNEKELSQEEIQERLKRPKSKNEDFVIEEFKNVGRSKAPYAIKNWVIHRGKGSARVNFMFKRILESAHVPDTLPPKVTARLDQGPRIASQGDRHR